MKKILCLFVVATGLFSCQKQEEVFEAKTAQKKTQQLPPLCGTDAVIAKFSDLLISKNKEVQSGLKARISKMKAGSQRSTKYVVLLDADGAIIKSTYWGDEIVAPSSGLTPQQVEQVKKAVQDDFSPWRIEVTLDEAVYNAASPNFRTRCILTQNSDWFCGVGYLCAGGVAFIGSGFWGDNTPCFVFTNGTARNAKFTADAASHEIGHTLLLDHQAVWTNNCLFISEYNRGYGFGPTSFAPIMGVGYDVRITNWFTGSTSYDCTVMQNDFARISENIPTVDDMEGLEIEREFEGILNYGGDVDINNLFLRGGGTTIRATSENADLKVTLMRKGEKDIAVNTNPLDTDAAIFVKRGGKFQLKVEAVSNENMSCRFMTGKYHISINR